MNRLFALALLALAQSAFAQTPSSRKSYPASAIVVLPAQEAGQSFTGVFYKDPKANNSALKLVGQTNASQVALQHQITAAIKGGQWIALASDGDEFEFVPPPVEDAELDRLKLEIVILRSELANCRNTKKKISDDQPAEEEQIVEPAPVVEPSPAPKEFETDEIIPGMPKKRG